MLGNIKMVKEAKIELVRLNVLLQEYGVSSRRKADELIESGNVQVNGKIVKTLGVKVEKNSSISVNGKILKSIPNKVTYLFNKPFMTITSRKDEKERTTIFDLPDLKKLPLNVQSVGRLDYRSEGLLILTNDGDLSLALSHPKYSVEKTYAVLVSSTFTIEDSEKLKKGVELEDGIAKAISVKIGSKEKLGNSLGQWIELVVTEGRNRLVRRMLEAIGLSVVRLIRVAIGDIRLPAKLEAGKMRVVTDIEGKYLSNLKKNMLQEINEKSKFTPSKDILEKRKLKKKISLNDLEYAKEAERREKRASLISKLRKKELAQSEQKRHTWKGKETNNSFTEKRLEAKENIYKTDKKEKKFNKTNLEFKPKEQINSKIDSKKTNFSINEEGKVTAYVKKDFDQKKKRKPTRENNSQSAGRKTNQRKK